MRWLATTAIPIAGLTLIALALLWRSRPRRLPLDGLPDDIKRAIAPQWNYCTKGCGTRFRPAWSFDDPVLDASARHRLECKGPLGGPREEA